MLSVTGLDINQNKRNDSNPAKCQENMKSIYNAVAQKDGKWWIGWVKEISGVNCQGKTRQELLENLRSALEEALQLNREDAEAAVVGDYEEVRLIV